MDFRMRKSEKGAAVSEYGVMLLFFSLMAVGIIPNIGAFINNVFDNTTSQFGSSVTGSNDPSQIGSVPFVPYETVSTPPVEMPFLQTTMVYESCDDAYWRGGEISDGYYRVNTGGSEFTIYCKMHIIPGVREGGWTLAILQHEVDSVPWISGITPVAEGKYGYPKASYTLSLSQIPNHTILAFGGSSSGGRPKMDWHTTGHNLFEIFADPFNDVIYMDLEDDEGRWGHDIVALKQFVGFSTCNIADTINYRYLFSAEQYVSALVYRPRFNGWLDKYVRQKTYWNFSPGAFHPAEKGACYFDGTGNDYYLTEDPSISWALFVK